MYSLEYERMVQVLRQLRSSGEFHADIPSRPPLRQGGRIILLVQKGNVVSCFILDKNGQKLYHDAEAQRLLPMFGVLDWKLINSAPTKTTASATSSSSIPAMYPTENLAGFIPRRLGISPGQAYAWSALERSVYSLVDGTRSIEQIALILRRPTTTIEQVIRGFEASRVITLSR
jgi:hypothetical protein